MKKIFVYITLSISLFAGFVVPLVALADTVPTCGSNCNLTYTPLEPLPGVNYSAVTGSNGLSSIVNTAFTILISVGALMAVLMLTIGGFEYMLSGGPLGKQKGIKRVQSSLWGIVLIAGIWLILHTINPNLLSVNLNPCPQGVVGANCVVQGQQQQTPTPTSLTEQQIANQDTQIIQGGISSVDPAGSAQKIQAAQQQLDALNANDQTSCTQGGGTPISGQDGSEFDPRIACNSGKYTHCTSITSDQITQINGVSGVPGMTFECAYTN